MRCLFTLDQRTCRVIFIVRFDVDILFLLKKYLFGCVRSWLRHTVSLVVMNGLSCFMACGILVP